MNAATVLFGTTHLMDNLQKNGRRAARAVFCCATLLFALALPPAYAEDFRFAAFGDLPYTDRERSAMPRWLQEISATQPAFLIHVGDFKASREVCSDELFADRHALFDESPVPLIYTPGDNEWSDCDLMAAGGYDPVERLSALQTLFFSRPQSLGKKRIAVEQQLGAVENLRWITDRIVFLTINLPAGNNTGIKPQRSDELIAREPKILAWIRQGFTVAETIEARAIVIAFQADPSFQRLKKGLASRSFDPILTVLQEESLHWKKPVLLIHGDSHTYRFDQPLPVKDGVQTLSNVWRLEVPGSPFLGWVEVVINASPSPIKVQLHPLKH